MALGEHYRAFEILVDYRWRADIVLADDSLTRIDPKTKAVKLKLQADGKFPTSGDTAVFMPEVNPKASAWDYFEALTVLLAGTDIQWQVKLADQSAARLYWNGAAWIDGGTTNFCSEDDVSAHLAELASDSRIQFIAKLISTDGLQTPELKGLRFSYLSRIDPLEDLLYRTMLPYLKEIPLWLSIRMNMPAAQDYLDLGALDDLDYEMTDIVSAFNLTNDPNRITNIGLSYDTGTRRVTFTGVQAQDDDIEMRMLYYADSHAAVGVDYAELPSVPAWVIDDSSIVKTYHSLEGIVRNKGQKKSRLARFQQCDWNFGILVLAPRQVDLAKMVRAIEQRLWSDPFVQSENFAERYSVIIITEPAIATSRSSADLREARLALEVKHVPLPYEEVEEPLVTEFKPSFFKEGT